MKCVLCGKRKGKRFCPAKNTYICAQCCGEKRVVEINCPPGCVYLTSGQGYQSAKKYVAQLYREEDPARRRRLYENSRRWAQLLYELEETIVHFAAGLRSFPDQNVLEAVRLLQETYKTEEKGLIYEHPSPNPLVQRLLRELRQRLEAKRAEVGEETPLLKRGDILNCLEVIETDIRYHTEHRGDSYLQFIVRNHPETASDASRSGLIQPS